MKKYLILSAFIFANLFSWAQNSILWEISGNGLKQPSYLFGTLKFIGEKEFLIPPVVEEKMKKCKIFAIEDQVDHHHQHELNKAVHFANSETLSTKISEGDYQRVQKFFEKEFKVNKSHFDQNFAKLIPLALSISMTRLSLGEKVKFYDIELLNLAKKNKLQAYSLEPIEREAEAIKKFPLEDQIKALLHSVDNFEKQKAEYKNLEAAYLDGDIDKVFEYSLHPMENNPLFIDEFYFKRNEEWLPKIQKMTADKPSFIAVGVSHLEGEKGLLAMLKNSGYTLTPVPVKH